MWGFGAWLTKMDGISELGCSEGEEGSGTGHDGFCTRDFDVEGVFCDFLA